jgi:hypothetical protein
MLADELTVTSRFSSRARVDERRAATCVRGAQPTARASRSRARGRDETRARRSRNCHLLVEQHDTPFPFVIIPAMTSENCDLATTWTGEMPAFFSAKSPPDSNLP